MVNKYGPVEDRIYKMPQRDSNGYSLRRDYDSEKKKTYMDRIRKWIES